jgi:hypothetical protein
MRNSPKRSPAGLLFLLLLLCFGFPLAGRAGDARITFRKVFEGSMPEFVEIKIGQSSGATFDIRQLSEDPDPKPFEVGPAVRAKIFELAGELHNFNDAHLDVRKKIANLGRKTFRYERDSEVHEVTFNYTIDPAAGQLLEIFEGLSRQQWDLVFLQRQMRFDRLGVNDALLQFETDLQGRILPEPERLLPTLDQLAGDPRFMDIARDRARTLAARIRASENQ